MATKKTTAPATPATSGNGNKPVHVERARGVRVSVFENVSDEGQRYYKTSISRVYKDKETNEVKTMSGLLRDDLLVASELLTRAWRWVVEQEAEASKVGEEQAQ